MSNVAYTWYRGDNRNDRAVLLGFSFFNKVRFACRALICAKQVFRFFSNEKVSFYNAVLLVGRFSCVAAYKPDIVHIHHIQLADDHLIRLLQLFNLKWIVSIRGYDISIRPLLSKEDTRQTAAVLTQAHGVHAVSEDLKKRAVQAGADPDKVTVIRRTVEEVMPVHRNVSYGPLHTSEYNVTTIGRFNWVKGLVFALKAIKLLADRRIDVHLHICGDGDVETKSELCYWIHLLSLENKVTFHGFLNSERINELLSKTHVYIQPSINEGIPNTLIRAAVNKIPVVASGVGGIPEIITDNVNGLLVSPGEPEELANAITRVLEDGAFRVRVAEAALTNISFDPRHEMGLYKMFYNKALSNVQVNQN